MAKIVSEHVVIEISRIAKEGQALDTLVTDEVVSTLEQATQALVGEGAVVEVKGVDSDA